MIQSPLVTVYITNYNYEDYISYAIESVLSQSLKDFELIIIDDGSTDNSKNIIEGYRNHEKISILYQQNKGLNATNNIALSISKGKYIMRLDADDYLHESALEQLSDKLENDPELGLAFPNYYLVNKSNAIISEEIRHDFDKEVLLLDQAAHGACTMIRTDFLKEVGGYNENYTCQDGYELWVKFTRKFKVSNVGTPLFYYRQHGANLTSNENRILDTRAQINADYIAESNIDCSCLVVIPVRGGEKDLSFRSIGETNFISKKVRQALQAKNPVKVVVSSPNQNIFEILDEDLKTNENVLFHLRSEDNARLNQSLNGTLEEIMALEVVSALDFSCMSILTIEFPFLKPHKIDDAIHTMFLFGSDSLLSVQSDNSLFYVHKGDGLHPILSRDQFTRLERETLHRQSGGITVVRRNTFKETGKIVNGMTGHMIIDQESSFGVFSQYDYELSLKIEHFSKLE